MLGRPIATRPLARDGLAQLTSDFGRTRLAEAPLPVRGQAEPEKVEKVSSARAARAGVAAASRP